MYFSFFTVVYISFSVKETSNEILNYYIIGLTKFPGLTSFFQEVNCTHINTFNLNASLTTQGPMDVASLLMDFSATVENKTTYHTMRIIYRHEGLDWRRLSYSEEHHPEKGLEWDHLYRSISRAEERTIQIENWRGIFTRNDEEDHPHERLKSIIQSRWKAEQEQKRVCQRTRNNQLGN